MRKSIEKNKMHKMKKIFITGLILTESILISCERFNNKGENMVYSSIEEQKQKPLNITYSKTEESIKLNENYVKVPNTNFSIKKNGNEIYIKGSNSEHKLENSKNLSHVFENNGKIYFTGIKNNYLEIEEYNEKFEKPRTLSFELIPNEKLLSYTISTKNGELILKGIRENGKPYELKINLNGTGLYKIYGN